MENIRNNSVKNEIKGAVMQLMAHKTYMDITVTDIVNRAGVARASFYRNFNSIYDVIDEITEEIANSMSEEVFPVLSGEDERKTREFLFHHFYEFLRVKKETEKLRDENALAFFSILDHKIEVKISKSQPDTVKGKYSLIGKLGLIDRITRKWLDTGASEPPEELVDYIMTFIMKI